MRTARVVFEVVAEDKSVNSQLGELPCKQKYKDVPFRVRKKIINDVGRLFK